MSSDPRARICKRLRIPVIDSARLVIDLGSLKGLQIRVLDALKGIVQPFELGDETRLILSYVKK